MSSSGTHKERTSPPTSTLAQKPPGGQLPVSAQSVAQCVPSSSSRQTSPRRPQLRSDVHGSQKLRQEGTQSCTASAPLVTRTTQS